MSAEHNFSPKKAFEALTPQPITGHLNTSRSGVRVGIQPPRSDATTKPLFASAAANIVLNDNVDMYDAEQLAIFFAKLSVHLGNDDAQVVDFAGKGVFE